MYVVVSQTAVCIKMLTSVVYKYSSTILCFRQPKNNLTKLFPKFHHLQNQDCCVAGLQSKCACHTKR